MNFEDVVRRHIDRYPLMQGEDFAKLAYQSTFGAEHMIKDTKSVKEMLESEKVCADKPYIEDIGSLKRFYLYKNCDIDTLSQLFVMTAQRKRTGGIEEKLTIIEKLVPQTGEFLAQYRKNGCPSLHHSSIYRDEYHPHYRVLEADFANFFCVISALNRILKEKKHAVVAIDGRCASGKTGLGKILSEVFVCNVFHMDDFYIPKDKRKNGWESETAGNIDFDRFINEVLIPTTKGDRLTYRPYSCQKSDFLPAREIAPTPLTVVEGSYSQHPRLADNFDLKIFLTCDKQTQKNRLVAREGDYYKNFEKLWIPMEEKYNAVFSVDENADLTIDTDNFFRSKI